MVAERLYTADTHFHFRNGPFYEFRPHHPSLVIEQMIKNQLDILCMTNHDSVKGWHKLLNEAAKHGFEHRLGLGVEITSILGNDRFPHIVALGLDETSIRYDKKNKPKIPSLKKPEKVIGWIHDHGGLAVAAHPTHKPSLNALTPNEIENLPFDAMEVSTLRNGYDQIMDKWAIEFNLARIGSTDTHGNIQMLGVVRTAFVGQSTFQSFKEKVQNRQVFPIVNKDLTTFEISNLVPFFARLMLFATQKMGINM